MRAAGGGSLALDAHIPFFRVCFWCWQFISLVLWWLQHLRATQSQAGLLCTGDWCAAQQGVLGDSMCCEASCGSYVAGSRR